jgi:hypothetical protein
VQASFGEVDAAHLRVGQTARVTVTALDNASISAHVVEVAPAATTVDGKPTYTATLRLDGDLDGLKAGMTAAVAVEARVDAR